MKNIVLIVVLLLSVNNLTQADMLELTKDSIVSVVDSMEAEILHFSNAEISKIIENSKSLNRHIQNMNIIRLLKDTVYLKINDTSIYSFVPQKEGTSCWDRLIKGISKKDLISLNLFVEKTVIEEFLFQDSISLSKRDLIFVDSFYEHNLPQEDFLVKSQKKDLIYEEELPDGLSLGEDSIENDSLEATTSIESSAKNMLDDNYETHNSSYGFLKKFSNYIKAEELQIPFIVVLLCFYLIIKKIYSKIKKNMEIRNYFLRE